MKTCVAEIVNEGKVNNKLCAFEKACFDAISEYAEKHVNDRVWKHRVVEAYLNGFKRH